jgi:protoporphyrinogen oxidase
LVIIGGGLTGLAAACEAQRLRLPCTLIEVKPRLGGAIRTHIERGFVMDGAHFLFEAYGGWGWLEALGLGDQVIRVGAYRDGDLLSLRGGMQQVVDALRARIGQCALLTRMAVSSLGGTDVTGARFGVCLENGVALPARAVLITAPARYAAHMLASLSPEAARLLDDHVYDPVARVHIGARRADLDGWSAEAIAGAPGVKFAQAFTAESLPGRVPPDAVLVRLGMRLSAAIPTAEAALTATRALVPAPPLAAWAHHWAEADSLSRYLPEHAAIMDAVEAALPPGTAIAGSDYRALRPDQAVESAIGAVRRLSGG